MGNTKKSQYVNYAIHLFTAGNSDFWLYDSGLYEELENHFGKIDYISDHLDFQKFTDYYNEEMGENDIIDGRMISFKTLGSMDFLPFAKIITNDIESKYVFDGKRKINLDIGYVHHTQFVLATTKFSAHRLPLGNGIYGEVTMMYVSGEWSGNKYSYANFKDQSYKDELSKIRTLFLEKRKLK